MTIFRTNTLSLSSLVLRGHVAQWVAHLTRNMSPGVRAPSKAISCIQNDLFKLEISDHAKY